MTKSLQIHDVAIGIERDLKTDGARETKRSAGHFLDNGFTGEFHVIQIEEVPEFRLINLPIAPDEDPDDTSIARIDHRLDKFIGRDAEISRHVIYFFHPRSRNGFELTFLLACIPLHDSHLGAFQICRVVTCVAGNNNVFAGVGKDHELVGETPADLARVSLDDTKAETATPEDIHVGFIHVFVAFLRSCLFNVETVSVFHGKFPPAHDAEPGPDFITKLGLNLVENEGKLLV